jgi:hypothetical protein
MSSILSDQSYSFHTKKWLILSGLFGALAMGYKLLKKESSWWVCFLCFSFWQLGFITLGGVWTTEEEYSWCSSTNLDSIDQENWLDSNG